MAERQTAPPPVAGARRREGDVGDDGAPPAGRARPGKRLLASRRRGCRDQYVRSERYRGGGANACRPVPARRRPQEVTRSEQQTQSTVPTGRAGAIKAGVSKQLRAAHGLRTGGELRLPDRAAREANFFLMSG